MGNRVLITEEQKKLSYAKFYDKPLAEVPAEKLAILDLPPMDPSKALKIQDRNKLFDPGYFEVETGYCVMEDGSGYIANHTKMPGVTVEMFDWWFAWHGLGELRYTLWDPEDHYYAYSMNLAQGRCPKLSLKEKYWGTMHHIKDFFSLAFDGYTNLFAQFFQICRTVCKWFFRCIHIYNHHHVKVSLYDSL